MNPIDEFINKIYETGLVDGQSGQVHELHSAIDRTEGLFLSAIIRDDPSVRRTLEVGCAYGLSSLHICAATRDRVGASHTIIDPFQNRDWDGAGVAGLTAAGVEFFDLIQVKSELALPQLLERSEGKFDFIFIDGYHTFDHTLLDCFYATRLLRIGGVLAIDDVSFPSVRRVVDFLKNCPCFEEVGSVETAVSRSWKRTMARGLTFWLKQEKWKMILAPQLHRRVFDDAMVRMIALRKTSEDRRNWDWHVDNF